ncbi:MAG TPA: hypothetical protein VF666_11245 [Pyrinomonadaceae bacterium]|jgi:hypothetical protein
MKKFTFILKTFCVLLVLAVSGCTGGGGTTSNPNLPNPGFTLITQTRSAFGIERPQPFTDVAGIQRRQLPPDATGFIRDFEATSSSSGILPVANGVAPAFWAIGEGNGPCAGLVAFGGVKRGDYNYLTCNGGLTFPFGFTPFGFSASESTTWTATGVDMNTQYGMPMLQVYDAYGNMVAIMPATECGYTPESEEAPASTWMSGSSDAMMGLPSGSYTADIMNQSMDDTGTPIGFISFRIFSIEPPPDPCDGGVQTTYGRESLMPPTCEPMVY